MTRLTTFFSLVDEHVVSWMTRHGVRLLRISLAVVFFWFGVLKFFPGLSPAEGLAARTIQDLTMGQVGPGLSLPILAIWECAIGLGLFLGRGLRVTLFLLFAQMPGTITPLFLYPSETFTVPWIAPTLEGQYIIKNLILISAGIVVGSTVRPASKENPSFAGDRAL